LGPPDNTETRWGNLIDILSQEDADIISLQEVTPRFLQKLQSQRWVQDLYSLSAADVHTTSLEPYGNLMLWKSASFHACGVYLCRDLNRNRALVVSLEAAYDEKATIFNVANVHLPADKRDAATGETKDRTFAQQRVLGAVIAKIQVLEQQVLKKISLPIILGDFNSGDNDPDLFQNDFFADAWFHSSSDEEDGFTFDWKRNQRAEKTRKYGHSERDPRRIDRIFVGRRATGCLDLQPLEAKLLGRLHGDLSIKCSFPPSDHFGLQLFFRFVKPPSPGMRLLYDPIQVGQNAWTTTAAPTTESLLALVLEDCTVKGTQLYDSTSTLPLAHVTLLNVFVDLSSEETQKIATQAVEDAVRQTLYLQDPTQSWPLFVDQQSLNVFEHRESATLVCLPSVNENEGRWLQQLYATLRVKFALCQEQESRFADGWKPHCKCVWIPLGY
jgi:endonuclease/exonuclease/phosphatase family metal-dependent hydrolase